MQAPGWSRLSEEAQSLVCQNLGRKELVSVCLVSKTCWISNARRELYRSPLPTPHKFSTYIFLSLILLLRTLRSSPGIARFVRDLSQLDACYKRMVNEDDGSVDCSFFSMRRQTNSFAWVLGMIEACSHLQAISLFVELEHLHKLRMSLEGVSSSLARLKITFAAVQVSQQYAFRDWIANVAVGNLEEFTLDLQNLSPRAFSPSNSSKYPHLLSLKKFSLEGLCPHDSVFAIHSFIPVEITSITSLNLSSTRPPSDLFQYLLHLSSQLFELEISLHPLFLADGHYPSYQANADELPPLSLFSGFSQLKKLTFSGMRITMGRLEALQGGSPDLEEISFPGSVWQQDSPGEKVLAQTKVMEILGAMRSLKWVDLGWTPCKDGYAYRALEQLMQEKQVSITYEKTDPDGWCRRCGSFHHG